MILALPIVVTCSLALVGIAWMLFKVKKNWKKGYDCPVIYKRKK